MIFESSLAKATRSECFLMEFKKKSDHALGYSVMCFLLFSLGLIYFHSTWLVAISAGAMTLLGYYSVRAHMSESTLRLRQDQEQKSALQSSEFLLRELFESAPEAILILELSTGLFVDANANAENLFKYKREDIFTKSPKDLSPPLQFDGIPSATKSLDFINKVIAGEKVVFEWEHIDSTGHAFISEVRLTRLAIPGRTLVRASIIDTTEKQAAEKKLAEANRELNLLFHSIDEVLFTVDMVQGKITQMSSACEKVYGYKPSDFMNDDGLWNKLVHPDDAHIIAAQFGSIMQGHEVRNQYRIIDLHKQVRWLENTVIPTLDDTGRLVRLDGVSRDITARKEGEMKVQESQHQINAIIHASPDAVIIIDEHSIITKWDQKAENLFGWREEEVMGMELTATIIPSHLRAAHERGMARFKQMGHGYKFDKTLETKAINKSNNELDISLSITTTTINGVKQFIGFIRDISGRKKSEETLRKSEANLRCIFDSTDVAYILLDTRLTVILCNQVAYDLSKQEIGNHFEVGADFISLLQLADRDRAGKTLQSVLQGQHIAHETTHVNTDGSQNWYQVRMTCIRDENQNILGICIASVDITDRKKSEMEIVALNESLEMKVSDRTGELLQVNKELEAFSYSVSHDLRAPLRVIDGFGRLLRDTESIDMTDDGKEYLDAILKNASQMGCLIDDLLSFSRLGRTAVTKEPVHMDDMVRNAIEEVRTYFDHNEVTVTLTDMANTSCDPVLIRQVWINILSNAMKYTRNTSNPRIEIGMTEDGNGKVYYVRDNGAGFDMKYANKLFTVFQRLHKVTEYEGTGIGLALVYRIITKHGGKIWADAKVNEGATFYFTLSE